MTAEQLEDRMERFRANPDNFYLQQKEELNEVQEAIDQKLAALTDEQAVEQVHKQIDAIQDMTALKTMTQCEISKCSFCCHSEIFIGRHEFEYIKKHGKYEIDQARLARQRATADYTTLSFANKACIMLKDGKCQVYEHRPALCRNHHVVRGTDPQDCFKQSRDLGQPGIPAVQLQEPKMVFTEALAMSITVRGAKDINDIKNIADWNW